MTQSPRAPGGAQQPALRLTIGDGLVAPAVVLALLLSLIYLPEHTAGSTAADTLIAVIAALYVVGMSIAVVRVARGMVFRAAGSTEPIVLLGSGADLVLDARLGARWRISAVIAGAVVAAAMAIAAGMLGETAGPTTYAHALTNLAVIANLVLAGSVLVPAPGFMGWALVLAAVDGRGAAPDARMHRASRLAQALGVPAFIAVGVGAGVLGDPHLMIAAFLIALLIRMRSRLAEGQDAIARFLRDRLVSDLARPILDRVDESEPLAALVARSPGAGHVAAVERRGTVIGAIGPRQLARRGRELSATLIAERMVALADVPQLAASDPAAAIIPAMARYGFGLVLGPSGLSYIEAEDVLAQILKGLALARSGLLGQGQGADDDHHDPRGDRRQR